MHPLLLPRLMLAAAVAFVVAAELSTPWADVDVDLTTTELVTRLKQVDAVQKQQLQRQQQLDGWEDTSKGSTPARQLLLEDQQQQQEQQQDRPTPLQQLDQQPLLERHHWAHHHASYRYLLTRRQRQRGISYYGSAERLRNALSRALKNKRLIVGVVGGSIAAGTGAEDAPPWVDRLQTYLMDSYGRLAGVNVTVNNGAVPGTTSAYMAACTNMHVPQEADIVIVEYSVNDDCEAMPILDNAVRRPYERLLRKLLLLPSRPAVVLLHAYAWLRPSLGQGLYYNNAERELNELASYYNLPALSVKGCCFHAMQEGVQGFQVHAGRQSDPTGLRGQAFYWDDIHPDGVTGHRVMSELVISLLQRGVADLLHSPFSSEDTEAAAASLPPPMLPANHQALSDRCFMGQAFRDNAVIADPQPDNWTWVNEAKASLRPKWGYVSYTPGSVLRLRVNTTASAGALDQRVLVQLAHLRSYEHMGQGSVTCESGCVCDESRFNGHTYDQTSLLVLHSLYVSQADECVLAIKVLDSTDAATGEHKVKLAAVIVSEEAGEGGGHGVSNAAAVEHVHDISFRHQGWGVDDVFDVRNHI